MNRFTQITCITGRNLNARLRSMIIQQLKDLKDLEETGVLDAEEFQAQKKKLANELLSL